MNKDKELELKVQMFCAAIRVADRSRLFWAERAAEDVNSAFKVLKHQDKKVKLRLKQRYTIYKYAILYKKR